MKRPPGPVSEIDSGRGSWLVHRLAATLRYGAIPAGWDVHHVCGRPLCVRPEHLQLVEPASHRGRMPNSGGAEDYLEEGLYY